MPSGSLSTGEGGGRGHWLGLYLIQIPRLHLQEMIQGEIDAECCDDKSEEDNRNTRDDKSLNRNNFSYIRLEPVKPRNTSGKGSIGYQGSKQSLQGTHLENGARMKDHEAPTSFIVWIVKRRA